MAPQRLVRFVLHVVLVVGFVASLAAQEWIVAFVSLLGLLTVSIPRALARGYRIRLPIEFELMTVTFVFGALYLGEVLDFYGRLPWWDDVLHAAAGIMAGFVGFLVLFVQIVRRRILMSPLLLAAFSISLALAASTGWEIIEFTIDQVLSTRMQNGLDDTMRDQLFAFAGATFAAASGYVYVRNSATRLGWFEYLLGRYLAHNPEIHARPGLTDVKQKGG